MSLPRTAVRLALAVLSVAAGALALLLSLITPFFWVLAGLSAAAAVVAALAPAARPRTEPAPDAAPAPVADAATVLTV